MPRKTRMYLPGVPAHVVQRGHNRSACFFSDDDHLFYLECLGQGLRRYGVRLHAYVLMTNHVHLLMTPDEDSSISRLMQHVGRLYVLYVNKRYRRSGALFEGRHKASLVAADDYLLTCYRYIEMYPVAAGMVPVAGMLIEAGDGVYRVLLASTMSGDWFVDAAFALPDGNSITRRFPVGVE